MEKITNYRGLYGETNPRADTNYIFSELLETRSRNFNWVINPHIHTNLYQLFFIESGEVLFKEATQAIHFKAPCIFVIPPTNLHGFSYNPNVTGRILTISENLIDHILAAAPAVDMLLNQIRYIHLFNGDYTFKAIIRLVEQLDEELFSDKFEKQTLLNTYLLELLIILGRLIQSTDEDNKIYENQSLKYFRLFQKKIRASPYNKNIPAFAHELGISAVHLNRVCQAMVGKSALEVVQEYVILEAQKYLKYTSYTISEIAYLLEFEYPNYFARLFKKHTGLSPTDFREKN